MLTEILTKLFIAIIKVYQNFISPMLPARCRYYPTCSEYGKTAIRWHGPLKGGLMTVKRLSSCHPLGGSGIDFVPLPLYKDTFYPLPKDAVAKLSTFNISIPKCSKSIFAESMFLKSKFSRIKSSKLKLSKQNTFDKRVVMITEKLTSGGSFKHPILIERGVYKDISSYTARLNAQL